MLVYSIVSKLVRVVLCCLVLEFLNGSDYSYIFRCREYLFKEVRKGRGFGLG